MKGKFKEIVSKFPGWLDMLQKSPFFSRDQLQSGIWRRVHVCYLIFPFVGNDSSHPSTWILRIPYITGDHMAMTVHHALTCSSSDIETYIIPGGFFCFLDHPLTIPDQFEYRTFFLTCQVKKILHMTKRDHQHMSFGHRIPVPTGIAEPVLCNDHVSGRGTEGTGSCIHALFHSSPASFIPHKSA
jgi:hypothetical protein